MRLLIDVDGVLRDIVSQIINIYKSHFDPSADIHHDDINLWYMNSFFPKAPDIINTFFIEYAQDVFEHALPYPGAVGAMRRLYERHHIHIVTNQFPGNEIYTLNWLSNWNIPYHDITFTGDKTQVIGDILLDDKLETIEAITQSSIPNVGFAVLMSRPWNRGWTGITVNDIKEFELFVNLLSQMEEIANGSKGSAIRIIPN